RRGSGGRAAGGRAGGGGGGAGGGGGGGGGGEARGGGVAPRAGHIRPTESPGAPARCAGRHRGFRGGGGFPRRPGAEAAPPGRGDGSPTPALHFSLALGPLA